MKALAEVPDDELMKLWEGLGYYNRARNLKAAAVQIMEEFDGEIPSDYSKLLALRGIGEYLSLIHIWAYREEYIERKSCHR